ncbi:UNVERIFIED_CONTAM: hypothetical protein Slati_0573400 [Sesamum latifolium]|uniref:Uncharacterized protein n=1 Tax=Sesamum latifolium TaxID=2727402 RepID=A0AAW2Y159_9LAMI
MALDGRPSDTLSVSLHFFPPEDPSENKSPEKNARNFVWRTIPPVRSYGCSYRYSLSLKFMSLRNSGRLAGRAIGYVQVARGQFESVMQQSQARQVHKELQDTMAQLEAIRHEIRSISFMNPGPLTTRLVDNIASQPPINNVNEESSKPAQEGTVKVESTKTTSIAKDHSSTTSPLSDIHSQATAYARLAESTPLTADSMDEVLSELKDDSGQFIVLPISAESANLLPSRKGVHVIFLAACSSSLPSLTSLKCNFRSQIWWPSEGLQHSPLFLSLTVGAWK